MLKQAKFIVALILWGGAIFPLLALDNIVDYSMKDGGTFTEEIYTYHTTDTPYLIDVTSNDNEEKGPINLTVNINDPSAGVMKGTLSTTFDTSTTQMSTSVVYVGSVNSEIGANLIINGNIVADISSVNSAQRFAYRWMYGVEVDYNSSLIHNGNFTVSMDYDTTYDCGPRGLLASGTSNYTLNGNLNIQKMRAVGNNSHTNSRFNTIQTIGVHAYDYNPNFNVTPDGPAFITLGKDANNTISIQNVIAEIIDTVAQPNAYVYPTAILSESITDAHHESIITVNGQLFIDNVFGRIGSEEKPIVEDGDYFGAGAIALSARNTSGIVLNAPATIQNIKAETYTNSYNDGAQAIGLEAVENGYITAYGPLTISNVSAKADKGYSYAYGIVAVFGGKVDIYGDLDINEISAEGSDDTDVAALYAIDKGVININQVDGDNITDEKVNTIKISGDVYADNDGLINAYLGNKDSYLHGLLTEAEEYFYFGQSQERIDVPAGIIDIYFANKAVWAPTGDDYFENTAHAKFNDGIIDMSLWNLAKLEAAVENNEAYLSSYFRTMYLNQAYVAGGLTYRTNSDVNAGLADLFTLGELTSEDNEITIGVEVPFDPIMLTFTGDNGNIVLDPTDYIPVFRINNTNDIPVVESGIEITREIGLRNIKIKPIVHQDPNGNGGTVIYLGGFEQSGDGDGGDDGGDDDYDDPSETVKTDDDTIILLKWLLRSRLSTDTLMRRMGDLRLDPTHNNDGIWVRMHGGRQYMDSSFKNRYVGQDYYGGQLGLDTKYKNDDNDTIGYFGLFGDFVAVDNTYTSGKGNLNGYGIGAYNTWMFENGTYLDLVGKLGKLEGDYKIINSNGELVTADFDTREMVLSLELGHRIDADKDWIIEPQAQITYGEIDGLDYRTNNGIRFRSDDIESLIGRLGFIAGREFDSGNLYFGGDFYHDFSDGVDVYARYLGDRYHGNVELSKEWYRLKVGGNMNISDDDSFYFEAATFLGKTIRSNNWMLNGGLRFGF